MGSTFYLFYMVLFTGGLLWCLFLWLSRDEEDEEGEGESQSTGSPSPGAARRPLPPGEAE